MIGYLRLQEKGMKTRNISVAAIAVLMTGAIVIFTYWSQNVEKATLLSNFGTFFGGILGTIFSFFTLVVLILTLLFQRGEAEHRKTKQDFIDLIEAISENLDSILEMKISVHLSLEESLRPEASNAWKHAPKFSYCSDALASELKELNNVLNLLEGLEKGSVIPKYYYRTYSRFVRSLREKGIGVVWNDAALQDSSES
jgi:uncharacterized membrane protein